MKCFDGEPTNKSVVSIRVKETICISLLICVDVTLA